MLAELKCWWYERKIQKLAVRNQPKLKNLAHKFKASDVYIEVMDDNTFDTRLFDFAVNQLSEDNRVVRIGNGFKYLYGRCNNGMLEPIICIPTDKKSGE